MSQAQGQAPGVAFTQLRSQTSSSHSVRGAASPKVLCPCGIPLGHWDVCSWPQLCQALDAGSGEAVMDQGILSLPGHSISVPCLLHGKIKTSLLILSTGEQTAGRRLELSG